VTNLFHVLLHYCPHLLVAEAGTGGGRLAVNLLKRNDTYNGCSLWLDWKVLGIFALQIDLGPADAQICPE